MVAIYDPGQLQPWAGVTPTQTPQPLSTGGSTNPYDITSNPDIYNQIMAAYNNQVSINRPGGSPTPNAQDAKNYTGLVNSAASQFASQFENLVGRAPTQDETNKFYTNFIIPHSNDIGSSYGSTFNQQIDSNINQFVGENYQKAAQDYATQQLQGQQDQANSLADLFRTQGNQAISDTESSLLDYQSQLFDRLRPNLLTSLKAQGLLDTGGLNEALAGQQGDLANSAANYVAQLKLQNDQQANNIAFSGASAPYQYQQSQIMNQPGQLQAAGQNALGITTNTLMDNLNYQHQLGLIQAQTNAQSSLQPSFLRTLGQSFGNSMGSSLGSWFGPGAGQSSQGGGNYSNMAKLFA